MLCSLHNRRQTFPLCNSWTICTIGAWLTGLFGLPNILALWEIWIFFYTLNIRLRIFDIMNIDFTNLPSILVTHWFYWHCASFIDFISLFPFTSLWNDKTAAKLYMHVPLVGWIRSINWPCLVCARISRARRESCRHEGLNKVYLQNLFKDGRNFSWRI